VLTIMEPRPDAMREEDQGPAQGTGDNAMTTQMNVTFGQSSGSSKHIVIYAWAVGVVLWLATAGALALA
ncbi:MAG: hypothetical protein KIT81_15690, partial [Alphaproteobacteria bacterium]|nr:hypothetical protein [Alphaproteobacteria bacterium]